MKVVAFNGSPRKNGNTAYMLNRLLVAAEKEGLETELVHIGGQKLQGCIACSQCFKNKDQKCVIQGDLMNEYIEKMIQADAIVIGSPTYFADMTAETKALIDRAGYVAFANGGLFARKVGAAVSVHRRGGAVNVVDSINKMFMMSRMIVPGSTYWNFGVGLRKEDVAEDEEALANMDDLGQTIGWLVNKISQ